MFGQMGARGGFGRASLLGGAGIPSWILSGAAIDMDFANARYYGGSLASLLSCSRASTGYATNADGTLTSFGNNALRIGVGTGLLVEEARTNSVFPSADQTLWATTSNPSSRALGFADPAGGMAATKIVFGSNGQNIFKVGTTIDNTPVTMSFYLRGDAGGTIHWGNANGPSGGKGLAATPITITSSWARYTVTVLANGATDGSAIFYNTGDLTTLYVFGAQLETGAFPTSYIPTTSAAVTRAADAISATGSLSTGLAAAAGSLVVNTSGAIASTAAALVDSSGNILLGKTSGNALTDNLVAGLTTGNTATWTGSVKGGIAWNGSGRTLILNNGTAATDANAMTPATTFHLGSLSGSSAFLNGYSKRLTAFNTAISAGALGGFTT